MKKLLILFILLLLGSASADAQEEGRRLALKEAIRLGVERNLDVKAALYTPAAAAADIYRNMGIYNPVLSLLTNFEYSATQTSNAIVSAQVARQKSVAYNAGISSLVPTGGTVAGEFNNSWNDNNFGVREFFQSDLTLRYTQPLLKNFGRETAELNINVARFAREGTLEQFRSRLLDTVSQVKSQYNQLHSLRKNLEVRKTSLELAETILSNTKAQVKAGVLPAMEVLNAEFGVATQQKNLIDAERALRDQVDTLRVLLQLNGVTDIIPTDEPFRGDYPVDETASIQLALNARPDLRLQQVTLKTSELQSRVARNQTLPDLSLSTSAAVTGLATTYRRDMERVSSAKYPVFNVGLQFTYPIGNDAANNDYIRSKLTVEQNRLLVRSLEESIGRDVRIAARAVRSGYVQLDVTARGRIYAEEVLQAFIKKQKVGLATTKDVLDVLNDLVTAQGNEIQAVTDYNNAIVALWRATGELLDREGITLGEKEAEALYEKNR